MTILAAAILALSMTTVMQPQDAVLTGQVVDPGGTVLPGATVEISGPSTAASAVTDERGRFRFDGLSRGPHLMTVSLAGFRTRAVAVRADAPDSREVVVQLATQILFEVLYVVPAPAAAYRQADAIAHVRIARTHPYGSCGDDLVVTARHDVSVLRVFKGNVPANLQLEQEAAGRCREDGRWHDGIERPYHVGEEYVLFLTGLGTGFRRLAGPSLAFRVRGERVSVAGFAEVGGSITLPEFASLLERLSREPASSGRR